MEMGPLPSSSLAIGRPLSVLNPSGVPNHWSYRLAVLGTVVLLLMLQYVPWGPLAQTDMLEAFKRSQPVTPSLADPGIAGSLEKPASTTSSASAPTTSTAEDVEESAASAAEGAQDPAAQTLDAPLTSSLDPQGATSTAGATADEAPSDAASTAPLNISGPCLPEKLFAKDQWPTFSSDPYPASDATLSEALDADTCLKDALQLANTVFRRNLARRRAVVDDKPQGELSVEQQVQYLMEPLQPCLVQERFGSWGEGGKVVCILTALSGAASKGLIGGKPPTVISIGSNGDTSFEDDIFKTGYPRPWTFDPYVEFQSYDRVCRDPSTHYFRAGLTSSAEAAGFPPDDPRQLINLTQALSLTRSNYAFIFKIDCEGCEYRTFPDLQQFEHQQPLGQIQVEIHDVHVNQQFVPLLLLFRSLGYRLFHAEPNAIYPEGYELAFIHENLVTLSEWRSTTAEVIPARDKALSASCLEQLTKVAEAAHSRNMERRTTRWTGGPLPYVLQVELLFVPVYSCLVKERFGVWDTGGAWVCRTYSRKGADISSALQVPAFMSVGAVGGSCSNATVGFEADLTAHTGGVAHIFSPDLTTTEQAGAGTAGAVVSVGVQVQGSEDSGVSAEVFKRAKDGIAIDKALELTKAPLVDVLRIDCEGCEFGIVADMKRLYTTDTVPFGQVLLQLHFGATHPELTTNMVADLEQLGYLMFWAKEDAYDRKSTMEVAFLHKLWV